MRSILAVLVVAMLAACASPPPPAPMAGGDPTDAASPASELRLPEDSMREGVPLPPPAPAPPGGSGHEGHE